MGKFKIRMEVLGKAEGWLTQINYLSKGEIVVHSFVIEDLNQMNESTMILMRISGKAQTTQLLQSELEKCREVLMVKITGEEG